MCPSWPLGLWPKKLIIDDWLFLCVLCPLCGPKNPCKSVLISVEHKISLDAQLSVVFDIYITKLNRIAMARAKKTEDTTQKLVLSAAEGTGDSKIRAQSTPKLRLSMRPNLFYNCRESSTNWPYFCKTNPISQKPK